MPPRPAAASPQERYRSLLEQGVVVVDNTDAEHPGTLTGLNREGATLRTELLMFGQPIQAHRFFPYSEIKQMRVR